ncbi:MAG: DUF167 domain-containing protein [Rhabdochlamydiaceae bacterium]|nr:DUF167 domain-containing protein [Rhabdochlamydiaceae bacterium]
MMASPPQIIQTEKGLLISIKVVLKSARDQIVGWENGMLKVKLNAVPEKGEANRTLLAHLAKVWKLPKSAVTLVSGETSRQKKICVAGISIETLLTLTPHSI